MSVADLMAFARPSAADQAARDLLARLVRLVLVILGGLLILAGFLIAPLPGPMGVPLVVLGLMLVLRNSFRARRHFVRFQHAHPKLVFPIRRLLRRDPEILAVAYQQALRMEKLVLPRRFRVAKRWRRSLKRKRAG